MNTQELAHSRIETYQRLRDATNMTQHPELAHTCAMRALSILHEIPVAGRLGEKQFRDFCHFPNLSDEIGTWKFQLGEITIEYPTWIAAGMFKDVSRVPWELFGENGMQVGFITVGGITLEAQKGNPKPRHFSFPNQHGLGGAWINRYGLNNAWAHATHEALKKARDKGRTPDNVPIIANICNGVNTLDEHKAWELTTITAQIIDEVDAIEVNISCPNQAGAQDLQKKISILVAALKGVKEVAHGKPIFLKISPDTDEETLKLIIEASKDFVTGYSSTNTTTETGLRNNILTQAWHGQIIGTKPDMVKDHGNFTLLNGGISGNPLLPKQLKMTQMIRKLAPNKVIIGIGGIGDEESAQSTIDAGAHVVALYSRLAQDGPWIIPLVNIGASRGLIAKK